MSMTRRDAIKFAEHAVNMTDIPEVKDFYRLASAALRPITREQAEKVWRGCDMCNGIGAYDRYAKCLTKTLLAKYCPHCGAPLTDEAVEMVMERMEELKNES